MEHRPDPIAYKERVLEMDQAIFYCFNESSEKLAVSIIRGFVFKDDNTLQFKTKYFPVTVMTWNSFGAELHFHRKGIEGSIVFHGSAIIENRTEGTVLFTIYSVESCMIPEFEPDKSLLLTLIKPYLDMYRKGSELLMYSFRRKSNSGTLGKISASA